MRILKLLKLYRQVSKLHKTIEESTVKKFWKSKTILFQLLTIAAAVTGVVPLPADVTAALVAAINVGLRLVTSEGVTT
jgi:hypothetical protein|tara:strand:- start:425 stop:658 length:234 start_codon:yes stop_codon:yes gene_type:complete